MHTPYFTMHRARTSYAHLMPEEESNLSLAEFGVGVNEKRVAIGAPKRPYTAPTEIEPFEESPNPLIPMARREGFDASLRSLVEPTSAQSRTGRLRHSMAEFEMARREGFEPPTLRFEERRKGKK